MPQAERSSSKKKRWAPHMQAHRPPGSASEPAAKSAAPLSPSHLFAFAAASARWEPFSSSLPPARALSSRPLRVVTWNTYSASPGHSDAQTRTLLRTLRSARADIIALQEISAEFEAHLQREAWARDFAMSVSREFFNAAGAGAGARGGKEGKPEAVVVMVRTELLGRGSAVSYERLEVGPGERGKALVQLRLKGASGGEVRKCTDFYCISVLIQRIAGASRHQ